MRKVDSRAPVTRPKSAPRQPPLARVVRLLRAHLPEISERHGIQSLGVFGSYVRGEQKRRSDLDVLVEYGGDRHSLLDEIELQDYLSDLLSVKVDLVPRTGLRPFIGKRILSEVLWLRLDGKDTNAKLPHRKKGGAIVTPKREHLDYMRDIVQAMERAQRYVAGKTFDDLPHDEMLIDALSKAVENIGEATKHIPAEVRNRYPRLDWKKMAGTRDHIAHGYFAIDLKKLWEIATVFVPQEKPLVAAALEQELERRREAEAKKANSKKP